MRKNIGKKPNLYFICGKSLSIASNKNINLSIYLPIYISIFISFQLSFDDPTDREQRKKKDKFTPCRKIFEDWNRNLSKLLTVPIYLTIDECLVPTRNRVSFKMYMPNKPGKYGINIKTLAGADVPYVFSCDVYAGKPAEV